MGARAPQGPGRLFSVCPCSSTSEWGCSHLTCCCPHPLCDPFFQESSFSPLSSSHQVFSLSFDALFPSASRGMRCFPSSPAQRPRSLAGAELLVWSAGDILWLGWLITRIPKSYQSWLDTRSDLTPNTHTAPQKLHKPARAAVIHLLWAQPFCCG